jgi:hypothetical protein
MKLEDFNKDQINKVEKVDFYDFVGVGSVGMTLLDKLKYFKDRNWL